MQQRRRSILTTACRVEGSDSKRASVVRQPQYPSSREPRRPSHGARCAEEDGDPVPVLVSDLSKLSFDELPHGVSIQPLERIDAKGGRHLALNGSLVRDNAKLVAVIEEYGWRKYWAGSLGVEEYHDLVRIALAARARTQGDVQFFDLRDDDVLYGLEYGIDLPPNDLRQALEHAKRVSEELLEAAEAVRVGIDDLVVTASKRLQGWGSDPLDVLVDRMREGTTHEKGQTLEELASRLFNSVPGFAATGHVVTETEEIDIRIQNGSDDPHWRDESYLLLAECKNWSSTCGKNEFVLFKNKLRNRVGRVSCGFLISWNGFAETVTKEMLRGSENKLLVVPVEGSDLRAAVREKDFPGRLKELHQKAVFL